MPMCLICSKYCIEVTFSTLAVASCKLSKKVLKYPQKMNKKPSKIQFKSYLKIDWKSDCKKHHPNLKKCSKWLPKCAPKGEPFRAFFGTCAPLAGHGFQHGSQKPSRRPQDSKISRFGSPKAPKMEPCGPPKMIKNGSPLGQEPRLHTVA